MRGLEASPSTNKEAYTVQSVQKTNPIYSRVGGGHKKHKTSLIGDYYTCNNSFITQPKKGKNADKQKTTAYLARFESTKDANDFW